MSYRPSVVTVVLALAAWGCASRSTAPRSPAAQPDPSEAPAAPSVSQAPESARALANPVAAAPQALRRGAGLYRRHCTACHGSRGRGDGPAAVYWKTLPKNLASPEVQTRFTDGELYWRIGQGHRSGADVIMPAFADKMSSDDRWTVVLFVRSLAAQP